AGDLAGGAQWIEWLSAPMVAGHRLCALVAGIHIDAEHRGDGLGAVAHVWGTADLARLAAVGTGAGTADAGAGAAHAVVAMGGAGPAGGDAGSGIRAGVRAGAGRRRGIAAPW